MSWYLYADKKSILPFSNNLSWSSSRDTLSTQLTFDSLINIAEGTHISLRKDKKLILFGVVTEKTKGKYSNNYIANDLGWYLNKNEIAVKQFKKISASKAITAVCSDFGIKANITPLKTAITKIYKDTTVSDAIEDILEQCKRELGNIYIKEMKGDTLYIDDLSNLKITPKILVGDDVSLHSSIEDMKNKIVVVSNDEKNNKIITTASSSTNIKKYGQLTEVITVEKKDESKARNIAKNELALLNKIARDLTFTALDVAGAEDIKANRLINLSIKNFVNGWYRIKESQHTLADGKHTVNITLDA